MDLSGARTDCTNPDLPTNRSTTAVIAQDGGLPGEQRLLADEVVPEGIADTGFHN